MNYLNYVFALPLEFLVLPYVFTLFPNYLDYYYLLLPYPK